MAKYSVYYERKVQIRPYEMLTIGLTEEFNSLAIDEKDAFLYIRGLVNKWLEEEKDRL